MRLSAQSTSTSAYATRGSVLALVLAGLCLGISPVLVKAAASEPVTVAMLRAGIAALAVLPFAVREMKRRGLIPRRQVVFATSAGIALGLDFCCWNIAVQEAGAGIATVLVNVQVLLMPLLVLLVERIRPEPVTWVLAPMMLLGVGLAGGLGSASVGTSPTTIGVVLGVAAGAGYTGYLYLLRRGAVGQNHWPITVLCTACGSAAVTAMIVGVVAGVLSMPTSAEAWALIVVLALVSQLLAFVLINRGVVGLPHSTSGVLLLLPSVFALSLAAVVLDQIPSLSQVIGCAVILTGAAYAAIRGGRNRTVRVRPVPS